MGERTCSVDGCERSAGVPGSARGFCVRHYLRWQRYGDPLGARTPRMRGCFCSVEGCDKPVRARGWCATHYSRWRRHGTIDDVRPHANVPPGMKWCPRCQLARSVAEFYPKPSTSDGLEGYCSDCARRRRREDYVHTPVQIPTDCHSCGTVFMGSKRNWKYCEDCRGEARAENAITRRARKKAAVVETVYRKKVFERDGWRCGICHRPVDRRLAWPDPNSPSLDHIVPLALDGEHSYANVQLAHLLCNVKKRTGGENEQLRLIG